MCVQGLGPGVGCWVLGPRLACVAPHLPVWVSSYRSGFIGRASSATDSECSSLECLHPMHRMYSVFLCLLGNRCTTERCCSTTTRSTTLATLAFAPAASPATWTATATLVRIVSCVWAGDRAPYAFAASVCWKTLPLQSGVTGLSAEVVCRPRLVAGPDIHPLSSLLAAGFSCVRSCLPVRITSLFLTR